MPKAVWYDPDRQLSVEESLDAHRPAVSDAVARIVALRSGRGHPAVEFVREDGALLSIATDGKRAFLVWTNPVGDTFHSVGLDRPGELLVYDYFGSWSEAPADQLVALQDAVGSAEAFLLTGVPDTAAVIYTPD